MYDAAAAQDHRSLTKSFRLFEIRSTGANSLPWTERPHTLTLSPMGQHTTWGILTAGRVLKKRRISLFPQHKSMKLIVRVPTGAYYNIIRVPPTKETAEDTLEGTTVLCSIPSGEKSKPSYYHSFGQQKFSHSDGPLVWSEESDLMSVCADVMCWLSETSPVHQYQKLTFIYSLHNGRIDYFNYRLI